MRNIVLKLSPLFVTISVACMENPSSDEQTLFVDLFSPQKMEFIKNEILRTHHEFQRDERRDIEYWDETFAPTELRSDPILVMPVSTPVAGSKKSFVGSEKGGIGKRKKTLRKKVLKKYDIDPKNTRLFQDLEAKAKELKEKL